MCYHFRLSKEATELENQFQAKFAAAGYQAGDHYNAFAHPRTPVITREQPQTIIPIRNKQSLSRSGRRIL